MLSFVNLGVMDYKQKRIRCMHTPTGCVVLKGVPRSRVKGRANEPC
jgi:hypothetical protein